jgi:ArsR family transcriptional regulator
MDYRQSHSCTFTARFSCKKRIERPGLDQRRLFFDRLELPQGGRRLCLAAGRIILRLTPWSHVYIFPKNDLEDDMKAFIRVMKALSDPTRVKMLKILEKRLMCVCELQTAIGAAQSTTSKHLKILEDAGLVDSHKDGLWVNYTLADGRQSPYAAALLGNLRHWLNDEQEISELMGSIDQINRFDILDKN